MNISLIVLILATALMLGTFIAFYNQLISRETSYILTLTSVGIAMLSVIVGMWNSNSSD